MISKNIIIIITFVFLFTSCTTNEKMKVSNSGVKAGTSTTFNGRKVILYPGKLKIGDNLNDVFEQTLKVRPIKSISIVNIVPSVDTPVCEEQTHILGETKLKKEISLYVVSRDLPMAQARFAKEANLQNITYLSDYKKGLFGIKTGLLMKEHELLARGVIVTDPTGRITYMQIVDDITSLPNMKKAFKRAHDLLK